MSELIPIETVEPLVSAAAHHYRVQAGKLAGVAVGLDDLLVIVHRYAGDHFGVVHCNVGAWGPVKGESRTRAIGIFNHEQVGAFAEHISLIPARAESPEVLEFVRRQVAPCEWQSDDSWARMRQRVLLCRPIWPATGKGAGVKRWLDTELIEHPEPAIRA